MADDEGGVRIVLDGSKTAKIKSTPTLLHGRALEGAVGILHDANGLEVPPRAPGLAAEKGGLGIYKGATR